ncbi:hypothetical protein LP125_052 [Listeria phage LP-125]|uniref:Uncharacterized protein n=3 Tax=Pecentumvirus TaxID=1857844 RepID=S4U6T8_9CAUD|nr:hypothetical protein QLX35_gp058 [Listeria phage LP-125]YP_009592587.1 hypothetical protein FDG78_gp058 [Listeria phage LP-064]AGI11377.1 hypothetical protein LP125_052 [Listeria phage LP-125]AHL19078.1 hypothetical protein LP064_058 [Listeria phage LP-064]QNL32001.1 hypothetical protein HUK30_0039 [Listeria phage LP-Mix_6.2]
MSKEYYVKYSSQEKNNCSVGTYTEVEELVKKYTKELELSFGSKTNPKVEFGELKPLVIKELSPFGFSVNTLDKLHRDNTKKKELLDYMVLSSKLYSKGSIKTAGFILFCFEEEINSIVPKGEQADFVKDFYKEIIGSEEE